MGKIPITAEGYIALEEELKILKHERRPNVIKAIAEAREHGDLSENAEYHAAREEQSFIEGRIIEIESYLQRSDIIDPKSFVGSDVVKFSATVELLDEDTEENKVFQLIGETEADISKGRLNINSPLAKALIGKSVGDIVEVLTPGGNRSYEITSIQYV